MAFGYLASNQALNTSANPVVGTVNIASTTVLIVLAIHTSTATSRGGGTPTQAGTDFTLIGSVTTKGGLCQSELWYIMGDDVTTGTATNVYSIPNSGTDVISVENVRFSIGAGKVPVFEDGSTNNGNSASPTVTCTGLSSGVAKVAVSTMTSEYHKTGPGFTGTDTTIQTGPASFDSSTKIEWSMYDINSDFSTTNVMSHSIATDVWHMVQGSWVEEDASNIISIDTVANAAIKTLDTVAMGSVAAFNTVTN